MSFFHRHRGLTPYLLLAPGLAWLAVFFIAPLGFLGVPVAAVRVVRLRLRVHVGLGQLPRRDLDVPRASDPLVRLRGARDAARASRQLSARLLDRVPRRAVEEPAAARDHRAVLRHVPDPDARVAVDPLGQRVRRRHAAHAAPARRGRTAARHVDRGRRGDHLQLPAVHGAAALRGARADRPAADRGRAGPLREQAAGVPPRDAAALAARRVRGHAADVHPRRR